MKNYICGLTVTLLSLMIIGIITFVSGKIKEDAVVEISGSVLVILTVTGLLGFMLFSGILFIG